MSDELLIGPTDFYHRGDQGSLFKVYSSLDASQEVIETRGPRVYLTFSLLFFFLLFGLEGCTKLMVPNWIPFFFPNSKLGSKIGPICRLELNLGFQIPFLVEDIRIKYPFAT